MKKTNYLALFQAFEKAPMEAFIETLLSPLDKEQCKKILLEDVSYHRYGAELVSLNARMFLMPLEKNRWIVAQVARNEKTGALEQRVFARGADGQQTFPSLAACIEYYNKEES